MEGFVGRFLLVLALFALLVAASTLQRRQQRRGTHSMVRREISVGVTILYFWGARCAACAAQKRVLDELKEEVGECLEVSAINPFEQPEMARKFSVMTVPTAVLLDRDGSIVYAGNGFVPLERLRKEVAAIRGSDAVA